MLRFRIARPARASAEGVCDVRSSLVSESSASSSAERSVSCVLANEGMSVGCGILFCFFLDGFGWLWWVWRALGGIWWGSLFGVFKCYFGACLLCELQTGYRDCSGILVYRFQVQLCIVCMDGRMNGVKRVIVIAH